MGSSDVILKISQMLRSHLTIFIALVCTCIGCGGGTTGSGDVPTVKVYGSVADSQGRLVSGGTVTDLRSGSSAPISTGGKFTISALPENGTVSLDVTTQDTSGSIQVKDLPSSTQSVAIKVVVDRISGIITVASVEIDPSDPNGSQNDEISQHVQGTITNRSGAPAKNVTVSIVETRSVTKSDHNGSFSLDTSSTTGTLKLRLTYAGLNGETVIRGIPKDRPCTLRVRLSISIEAGQNPGQGGEDGATLSVEVDSVSVS